MATLSHFYTISANSYCEGNFTAAADTTDAMRFCGSGWKLSATGSWTGSLEIWSRRPAYVNSSGTPVAAGTYRLLKSLTSTLLAEAYFVSNTAADEEFKVVAASDFSGTAAILISGGPTSH